MMLGLLNVLHILKTNPLYNTNNDDVYCKLSPPPEWKKSDLVVHTKSCDETVNIHK